MDAVISKPSSVFIQYAAPSVLGMLAISSAGVVDGFFVGNYIGSSGLAAINLSMPIFSLLFGLALMLAIGSSVVSGKLMAEGNIKSASKIFSQTFVAMAILSFSVTSLIYLYIDSIFALFGATGSLHTTAVSYLQILLIFMPVLMVGLVLDYYVKIDNRPSLAFLALLFSALINIFLDWLLIVYLNKGIFGAALATGLSQLALIVVLLPHFFSKRATIKFVKPVGAWISVVKAGSNGASEFVNETSVGITTLIFNYIMLQTFGVDGVAAYTVVSYLIWISIMISFGISDSLQPIISKNYGARKPQRIEEFLKFAFCSTGVVGLIVLSLILLIPEHLTDIFLESDDKNTITIVLEFTSVIWPLFLFNGINLVISAYFTAIHRPVQSATIALSRSLVLPLVFIYVLPLYFGHTGTYIALPAAEFLTMILAIIFFIRLTPKKLLPEAEI